MIRTRFDPYRHRSGVDYPDGLLNELRTIWATDAYDAETGKVALVSRQTLQALILVTPVIALAIFACGVMP